MEPKPLGQDTDGEITVRWDHQGLLKNGGLLSSLAGEGGLDHERTIAIWESHCDHVQDWLNFDIAVSDFVAGPVVLTSPYVAGEVQAWRILFLGPGHRPLALTQLGAMAAIESGHELRGSYPPWDPPLWICIRLVGRKKRERRFDFNVHESLDVN